MNVPFPDPKRKQSAPGIKVTSRGYTSRAMIALLEQHRASIAELCRKHSVKRLDLFGSAARGGFDPARSDIDFFVEFQSYESPMIADQWFGLQEDLQALLAHPVQLTSRRAADNPYFLEVADRDKVVLYAA